MTLINKFHALLIALCALFLWIGGDADARSLGGHCSNWMTTSLSDQNTRLHDVNATRVACTALRQSGDFVTDYDEKARTCLVCSIDDWTAASSQQGWTTIRSCRTNYGTVNFTGSQRGLLLTYPKDGKLYGNLSGTKLTDAVWTRQVSGRKCSIPKNGSFYWGYVRGSVSGSAFTLEHTWCDGAYSGKWRFNDCK